MEFTNPGGVKKRKGQFLPAPPHSYDKTKLPLLVFKIPEISLT